MLKPRVTNSNGNIACGYTKLRMEFTIGIPFFSVRHMFIVRIHICTPSIFSFNQFSYNQFYFAISFPGVHSAFPVWLPRNLAEKKENWMETFSYTNRMNAHAQPGLRMAKFGLFPFSITVVPERIKLFTLRTPNLGGAPTSLVGN